MTEKYKQEFLDSLTDKEKVFYSEPMNQTLHARFESFRAGRAIGFNKGFNRGCNEEGLNYEM